MIPLQVLVAGAPASHARFLARWDDENFYVATRVADNTPQSRAEDHSSDTVSIGFDGDRDGLGQYGGGDAFVMHRSDGKRVAGFNDADIARAAAKVKGGYVMEFSVPWKVLGGKPEPGRRIGFEIRNHDQGLPSVDDDGQWQWASGDAAMPQQTSDFGIVELAP